MNFDQTFINWCVPGLAAVFGWFCRSLWDAQKELRADLNKLHVEISKEYVTNHRLDTILGSIEEHLKYIRGRVDKVT